MAEQNYSNHTKFFPLFHFFVAPVMAINLGVSIDRCYRAGFSLGSDWGVVLALGLLLGFMAARLMALTVQDRVIRLEEQLRYQRVLPADLQARAGELSLGQIVSLRFASDAELPALMRKVLDEKIEKRKPIKQMVKNWRPDYLRA